MSVVAISDFLLFNQSINKFISRHSTEARATVRLCRIKDKCLNVLFTCVPGSDVYIQDNQNRLCTSSGTLPNTSLLKLQMTSAECGSNSSEKIINTFQRNVIQYCTAHFWSFFPFK